MLGWLLVVRSGPVSEPGSKGASDESVLATWQTELGGTQWLDEMVASGKAEQVAFGGYPCRYTARASDVLRLLADGPPGYSKLPKNKGAEAGWIGRVQIHADRFSACAPDDRLTIDAWDQS